MNSKEKKRSSRNEKIGKRLKECMDAKNMIAAKLIKEVQLRYHVHIPDSYVSQAINGNRPLNSERAILFARILNVKPGYLLGDDGLYAKSYNEYLQEPINSSVIHYLDMLLDGTEFFCKEVTAVDDVITDYKIQKIAKDETTTAVIPAERIDSFFDLIKRTVSMNIETLVEAYSSEESD